MKKIIYFVLAGLLLIPYSCQKFLTIEPTDEILTEDAINSVEDIQKTLVSCYDVLRNGNFFGGNMWTMSDLMADNTEKDFSDFGWDQISQRSMNLFNTVSRETWANGYYSIERSNYVLYLLDNSGVQDLTDAEKNRIEGECRFIRAISHFELVRFFALPYDETKTNDQPGIPLRLEPILNISIATTPIPRSSVETVYDTVINELQKAAVLLPDDNNGYATSWAAKAYLAKVYFQMNNFDSAYFYADDIIENGGFQLDSSVQDRFSIANSQEAVFELQTTGSGSNSASTLIGNYRQNNPSNPGFYVATSLMIQALNDDNDTRQAFYNTRYISGTSGNERTYCAKYDYDLMNVPVVHLTEILLIRAESAIDKSTPDLPSAIADLQTIRNRAYGVGNKLVPSNSSATDLRTIARFERRLELAFEGNRMHDLKRCKQSVRDLSWNSNRLVCQIPDIEQAGNPDIVLNPTGD